MKFSKQINKDDGIKDEVIDIEELKTKTNGYVTM